MYVTYTTCTINVYAVRDATHIHVYSNALWFVIVYNASQTYAYYTASPRVLLLACCWVLYNVITII